MPVWNARRRKLLDKIEDGCPKCGWQDPAAQRVAEIEEQEAVLDRQLDADFNSLDGDDGPIAEVGDRITTGNGNRYHEVTAVHTKRKPWCYMAGGVCRQAHEIADVYTRAEQATNDALIQIHLPAGKESVFDHPEYCAVRDDVGSAASILDTFPDCQPVWFITAEAVATLGQWTKVDRPIEVGRRVRDEGGNLGTVLHKADEDGDDRGYWIVEWDDPAFDPGLDYRYSASQFSVVAKEDPAYPGDAEPGERRPNTGTCCRSGSEAYPAACPLHGPPNAFVRQTNREVNKALAAMQKVAAPGVEESPKDTQRPWAGSQLISAGGHVWVLERPKSPGRLRWRRLGADGPKPPGLWMSDDEIAALGPVCKAVIVTLPERAPDVEVLTEVDWQRDPVECSEPFIVGSKITIKIKGDRHLTPQEMVAELLAAAEVGGERNG